MTIQEMFEQLPTYVDESAIQGVDRSIQFHITGEDPGDYFIQVTDGQLTTHQGVTEEPDATITSPSDVWIQIATGEMNAAVAYMSGKFKAEGDMGTLMAMQGWFNRPA